jgi:transcription initiation factor IIF auxiliary subunit
MRTQSPDTSEEIEKKLIEETRKLTTAQKFAQVSSMSQFVANLSKRAIKRANPNATKRELDLIFVRLHYGEKIYKMVERLYKEV